MTMHTTMTTQDEQDDVFGFEPLTMSGMMVGIAIGLETNLVYDGLKEAGVGKGLDPITAGQQALKGKGRPS